jgi:hypothetical protein
VDVLGAAQLAEEVLEVVALGEAGELRRVVQPHVEQAADAGFFQGSEEGGG